MGQKTIFSILLIFVTTICFGQSWSWAATSVGTPSVGTEGYAICSDKNNNVYITGLYGGPSIAFGTFTLTNSGSNASNIFVTKYDPNGNVLWTKGSTGFSSVAYGICTDTNNNVFITGFFNCPTIIFGTDTLTNTGTSSIFIVKYDSSGNLQWAKNSIGAGSDEGHAIAADKHGNVYVSGFFSSAPINFDTCSLTTTNGNFFLTKYNSGGTAVWARSASGGVAEGLGICTDNDRNIYLTGAFNGSSLSIGTYSISNSNSSTTDIFLAKFNDSGNVLWIKGAGGSGDEGGYSVTTDACGNAYICGYFTSSTISIGSNTITNTNPPKIDAFFAKYDSAGNNSWAQSFKGINDDFGYSTSATNDGIYVSGGVSSPALTIGTTTLTISVGTGDPVYLAKFDFNGNLLCASSIASGGDDQFQACADRLGSAYLSSDYIVNPFVIGQDTLIPTSIEEVFVTKYTCSASGSNCAFTGISEINHSTRLNLFPNPNNGSFKINMLPDFENSDIILFNSIGQKVFESKLTSGLNTFDINYLSHGFYSYIIITQGTLSEKGKLTID